MTRFHSVVSQYLNRYQLQMQSDRSVGSTVFCVIFE